MTPSARIATAIAILDRIALGEAAEKALTNWARSSRYAGSKDRAAVRDHVYDALRRWNSTAITGGAETGRGRMVGLLRQTGMDPDDFFDGQGHAPAPLTDMERRSGRALTGHEAWDMPDWLCARLQAAHPKDAASIAEAQRHRAPVFLRVNTLKSDRESAHKTLAAEGMDARAASRSETALEVLSNPRRVAQSKAFAEGLVELQDASSQAVVDHLPLAPGNRVLDYCAGGGGKALAIAARLRGPVDVHDADPRRMGDIPARSQRAGAVLRITPSPSGSYDLVLCDVPCSGSGAWRRAPEGKWRLTPARLQELRALQQEILAHCAALVAPQGTLAYATCSVLAEENQHQVDAFLAQQAGWEIESQTAFQPDTDGDGLFVCIFRKNTA